MFFIFPNCLFCFSRIENSMNKLVQINQYSSQYKTYYYCKTKLLSNTNFLSIFEHLIMENKIIGNIMGKNFLCPILSNHHLSCPFPLLCADRPRLAVADIWFRKGIGFRYFVLPQKITCPFPLLWVLCCFPSATVGCFACSLALANLVFMEWLRSVSFRLLVAAVSSAHVFSDRAFNFFKVSLTICFVSLSFICGRIADRLAHISDLLRSPNW